MGLTIRQSFGLSAPGCCIDNMKFCPVCGADMWEGVCPQCAEAEAAYWEEMDAIAEQQRLHEQGLLGPYPQEPERKED